MSGNYVVIGRCGNCHGRVVQHTGPLWMVGPPPRPACESCGATVRGPEDEVLPMNPAPPQQASLRDAILAGASTSLGWTAERLKAIDATLRNLAKQE